MSISIMVATPAYNGQVYVVYTNSLLNLFATCVQRGIGFSYAHTTSQSLIPAARNDLAEHFMNSACTHLLFIDGDMGFEANQVLRMLEADADVVGAICPQKKINWSAIKHAILQNPDIDVAQLPHLGGLYKTFQPLNAEQIYLDEAVEVEQIGTGIMFIKRTVFERLQSVVPKIDGKFMYFESKVEDDGRFLSEDLHFCREFRRTGGKIFAAPWLEVSHLGTYEHKSSLSVLASHGLALD